MQRKMTFEEFKYHVMIGSDTEIDRDILNGITALSGKWKLQILYFLLLSSSARFNNIKRFLGTITSRQLIIELRQLEVDGFIQKSINEESPEIREYVLLDKGKDLIYLFYDYMNWSFAYSH